MDKRFTNYQTMDLARTISLLSHALNNVSSCVWWEQKGDTEYAIVNLGRAKEWAEDALKEINMLYDVLTKDEDDKDNN